MTKPKKLRRKLVKHSTIPDATQMEVGAELSNFSVALGRVHGEDASTFQLIGSGVCVVRNGVHGILTAHHCLHACSPEVSLGELSQQSLVFLVKRGRIIRCDAAFLLERELGTPRRKKRYTRFGPDLTFIEIPAGPTLAQFQAYSSFFSLDRSSLSVRRKHCTHKPFIGIVGYPEADHDVTAVGNNLHLDLRHVVMAATLRNADQIKRRNRWDYVTFTAYDQHGVDVPASFGGFSGGGIWAVTLRHLPTGQLKIEDFCLVGINYFQSGKSRGVRKITGHFVRSIYSRAWQHGVAVRRQNQVVVGPKPSRPAGSHG